MSKDNYAAVLKVTVPHRRVVMVLYGTIAGLYGLVSGIVSVGADIIDERKEATGARLGPQTGGLAGDPHAQPPPRGGCRSALSRRRVLRSARLAAGALRDGAPASHRRGDGGHHGAPVRCVGSDGVSSGCRVRSGGVGGVAETM